MARAETVCNQFTPHAICLFSESVGMGHRILSVASEWFSYHGGLSTFNRSFCAALASAGHDVCCLVPRATPEELDDAKRVDKHLLCRGRFRNNIAFFSSPWRVVLVLVAWHISDVTWHSTPTFSLARESYISLPVTVNANQFAHAY